MNRKGFVMLGLPIAALLLMTGCGKNALVDQVPLGVYSYTAPDGQKATFEVLKDTVVLHDPSGAAYEEMKEIYALLKLQNALKESAMEGISLSDEEKKELVDQFRSEANLSDYDGKELQYKTEFYENDMIINLYPMEKGEEITGFQMTYYCRDHKFSYSGTEYLTLEEKSGEAT